MGIYFILLDVLSSGDKGCCKLWWWFKSCWGQLSIWHAIMHFIYVARATARANFNTGFPITSEYVSFLKDGQVQWRLDNMCRVRFGTIYLLARLWNPKKLIKNSLRRHCPSSMLHAAWSAFEFQDVVLRHLLCRKLCRTLQNSNHCFARSNVRPIPHGMSFQLFGMHALYLRPADQEAEEEKNKKATKKAEKAAKRKEAEDGEKPPAKRSRGGRKPTGGSADVDEMAEKPSAGAMPAAPKRKTRAKTKAAAKPKPKAKGKTKKVKGDSEKEEMPETPGKKSNGEPEEEKKKSDADAAKAEEAEKRRAKAKVGWEKLLNEEIPNLTLPKFMNGKISFTLKSPVDNGSNVGVILNAESFYISKAVDPEHWPKDCNHLKVGFDVACKIAYCNNFPCVVFDLSCDRWIGSREWLSLGEQMPERHGSMRWLLLDGNPCAVAELFGLSQLCCIAIAGSCTLCTYNMTVLKSHKLQAQDYKAKLQTVAARCTIKGFKDRFKWTVQSQGTRVGLANIKSCRRGFFANNANLIWAGCDWAIGTFTLLAVLVVCAQHGIGPRYMRGSGLLAHGESNENNYLGLRYMNTFDVSC